MNRTYSTTLLLGLLLILAKPDAALEHSHPAESQNAVWIWSNQCAKNHELGVIISLGRKVLYRGVIPICSGSRDGEKGRAEFYFSGGHLFQNEYSTGPSDLIEGNIWQASGETDALILGVSFTTKTQILLNTLHVAKADKLMSTELDKGLFMKTYPMDVR